MDKQEIILRKQTDKNTAHAAARVLYGAASSDGESAMLKEQIDTALKADMKAGDQNTRVATLRLINAAIKDRDIAARSEDRCGGVNDPCDVGRSVLPTSAAPRNNRSSPGGRTSLS